MGNIWAQSIKGYKKVVSFICLKTMNAATYTLIKLIEVKVKCSRYRPAVAQRVGRGIALLFHDRGTRRGWVVSSTPRPHFIQGKTQYPLYRRLSGLQGRSGRAENLVPTGIRSRTVQPVVSHYTDWASRPTLSLHCHTQKCFWTKRK